MLFVVIVLLAALVLPWTAHAQDVEAQEAQIAAVKACRGTEGQVLLAVEGEKIGAAKADFEGLGFGGGYGTLVSLAGRARVQNAELVSGVVRVNDDDDVQFGPILELHKFSWPLSSQTLVKVGDAWVLVDELPGGCVPTGGVVRKVPLISAGPFVSLRLGAEDVVQSFGVGLIFGFRKAESDKSLNLGFAFAWDPNVTVLGDGIEPNQPLPTGETQVRYRTTSQTGVMVIFSVGW